tara:strand:- start:13561 stop:14856 length:1296 start_codon:yes stop_codon:yes gene_type:complete
MKIALLVVDNPHREMRGMVGVSKRLKKKNIFTHIISKTSLNDWYAIFNPDIVVLPRATPTFMPFIKKNHLHTKIVIIPSEHGSGFENKMLSNIFGRSFVHTGKINSSIELAFLILVGGENQKNWILKAMPILSNKVKVVGTLNSDHWLKPQKNKLKKNKIGICTSLKSLFLATRFTSTHKLLYDHLSPDYKANQWRLEYINFEQHYLSVIFEAIDKLTDAGYDIDIRPHPHENFEGWKHWLKSVKNEKKISLNRDIDITRWIDSKHICITSFSTTSLDCIARGVPAISLEKLFVDNIARLPKIKTPLTSDYSWNPSSLEEMMRMIEKASNGKLEVSPNIKSSENFMKNNFYWPRDKSSATLCADEIFNLINKKDIQKKRRLNFLLKTPLLLLKIILRDLRDFFGPRKSNLLFVFSFRVWYSSFKFNKDLNI